MSELIQARELLLNRHSWYRVLPYLVILLASLTVNSYQAYSIASPLDAIYSDMGGYVSRAWRLASGDHVRPFDTFYPPGTTYFFATVFMLFGLGIGLKLLVFLQVLMLSLANLLVALCAQELYANRKLSLFAGLIATFYWPFATQASFFMAEPLFIFSFLLIQYFFIRSIHIGGSHLKFFSLGLGIGLLMLVKGQGIVLLIAILLSLAWRHARYLRAFAPALLVGFIAPIALQMVVNSTILKKTSLFVAANDSFNLYLGQSQLRALGCHDRPGGYYYIFHNNNSAFNNRLGLPRTLPTSIMDREYFREKTKALWDRNPALQVIRSLHNARELFSLQLAWPGRNLIQLHEINRVMKYAGLIIVVIPLFYSLALCINRRAYRWQVLLLLTPVILIGGIAFVYMGQPRYLIPFQYNLILLSIPAYIELSTLLEKLPRPWRKRL